MNERLSRFLKDAGVAPVSLGVSREQVRAALGNPTASGATSRKQRVPLVERFEDIEVGYEPAGEVKYVALIIGPPISLQVFLSAAAKLGLNYEVNGEEVMLSNGVRAYLDGSHPPVVTKVMVA